MTSARVEQTLERFQEDERLTGDLTDDTATALLGWIEQQIRAADALPEERVFEQHVAAIRSAARTAASARAADPTPVTVVQQAQAALQALAPSPTGANAAPTPAADRTDVGVPAPAAQVEPPQPAASVADPVADPSDAAATPLPSLWRTLRRRVRRWTHRKAS